MAVEGIRLALIFIIKKEKGIYKGGKYPINGIGRILYLPQQIRNEADMNMKTGNRGNRKEEKLTGNRDRLAALGLLAASVSGFLTRGSAAWISGSWSVSFCSRRWGFLPVWLLAAGEGAFDDAGAFPYNLLEQGTRVPGRFALDFRPWNVGKERILSLIRRRP